jgi:branched-chain amino acid aminotransferase
MALLNYNGVICTDEDILAGAPNRAWRYGDGLIETMLWQKGGIRLFDMHVQRLQQSLEQLRFPSFGAAQLKEAVHRVILVNQEPERAMVRAQFFLEENNDALQYLVELAPLEPTAAWPHTGLTIGISDNIIKSADSIAPLKSTSRLSYIVAAREAADKGWDDVLILNDKGRIAESTICNVFLIKDRAIYTPSLHEGCIAGIMRAYLLTQGAIAGLHISEKELAVSDLDTAQEIFLTNAIRGIRPVTHCQGKIYESTFSRAIFDHISNL